MEFLLFDTDTKDPEAAAPGLLLYTYRNQININYVKKRLSQICESLSGADNRTRTCKALTTRSLAVRVCQFRHVRMGQCIFDCPIIILLFSFKVKGFLRRKSNFFGRFLEGFLK